MFIKKRTLVAIIILVILVIGTLLFLMFSPIPAPQKAVEQELDASAVIQE